LITAVLVVVFSAWLMFQWGGAHTTALLDDVAIPVAAFAAAATTMRASFLRHGGLRFAWVLIGASCAAWGAGEAIWGFYDAVLGVAVPFPSLADVGYRASIPLGVAGILSFRSLTEGLATEIRGIIDGLIIATSLLLVSWLTTLGAVFSSSGDSTISQVISLSYPVGDIVSLTMVAFVVTRSRPDNRLATMLVGAGFATNAVTDSLFALFNAKGIYTTGSPIDAGWLLSFCLIALAPLAVDHAHKSGRLWLPRIGSALATNVPIAIAMLAIGVEAAGLRLGANSNAVNDGCVLAICALVVARLVSSYIAGEELDNRQQRAQSALQETERTLWEVVQNGPFGILATDRQGVLKSCVGQVLTALHLSPQSLVGVRVTELLGDAAASEAIASALRGTAATARIQRGETELQMVVTPTPDAAGHPNGVIAVVHDIGEHQKALEARGEAEQKSRFVSMMTHEIRNPLNSVLGYTELLSRPEAGPLNEKQAKYLDRVSTSGRFLLAIVNDILDLAKAGAGRLEVNPQAFDPVDAVSDAVTLLHPIAEARGVILTIDGTAPVACLADRARTHQVVVNLLSNAIKFTRPASRVVIAVNLIDGEIRFRFIDHGEGIPEDQLERIFEEFAQVAGQTTEIPGTGLGLPLSRALARAMGGEVSVRSTVGLGSVFTLTLPMAAEQHTEAASKAIETMPLLLSASS
jgi:signal transduction histidine kinase